MNKIHGKNITKLLTENMILVTHLHFHTCWYAVAGAVVKEGDIIYMDTSYLNVSVTN